MKFNFKSIEDLPDAGALQEMVEKQETIQEIKDRVVNSINWAVNNDQSSSLTAFDNSFNEEIIRLALIELKQKGYIIKTKTSYSFRGVTQVSVTVSWDESE